MQEVYRLVLQHYFVADDGDRLRIDEPIVVKQIFDRRNGCTPIVINRLFDELKRFTLLKMSADLNRRVTDEVQKKTSRD